ncbi:MAG TPA: polysaccharide deacetylase family protein, partial [Anaerolineae bacterium]|nr:polysaccharide deacetylase family protein [Anaerolineae bacterium]
AGLGLVGLLLLACNLFQTGRPTSSAAPLEISYVTATPGSAMALSEGQRFQGLPPMNPAPQPLPGPYFAGANEMGKVIVLEYHHIGYPEQRYQRTPAHLRADLERLYQNGYYPVNFIEIIRGLPEVPPGKKPIALTFDDSDISQFRVLDDLTIDGDSAVGILLNFHKQHPEEWPMRATFFVLGNDNGNHYSLFGQSDLAKEKMQVLVDLGMEIGSHTVSHADLSVATAERIYWELAVSQHVIEELVPGYKVQSLSVPFGGFPFTLDFLKSGQWGDMSYSYAGNAAAWGGPTVSPFDSTFEPYHVSRLEVTATSLDYWLTYFEQNPHAYYISDGDPNRLTFPQELQVSTEK